MASENCNPLAELATNLIDAMTAIADMGLIADRHVDAISHAQRIVEELSKVEDRRNGETNSDVLWRCNDCIAKCRAIAEEGTKDGK